MSQGAQFDWSRFGAKPVKPAFDWSKFGAKPVITSPQFDTDLARAKAEKAQALQEKPPGVIEQLLTPPWEFLKGSAETIRRNVAPHEGEANLLQRIAGPGPGIAQDVATGLVQAQREAGQEYLQRAATEKNPLRNVERFLEAGIPVAGPLYRSLRKKVEAERPFEAVGETGLALLPFGRQPAKQGFQRARSALAEIGRKPQVAQSVVKEALTLPPKAVTGVEDIFRAAAPVGSKPSFRSNMYAAAGDLAEIGEKLDLKSARGGFRNPDMRPRATVQALNDHLKTMYQQERAPQITRQVQVSVEIKLGADATEGLAKLEEVAGTAETRALISETRQSPTVTIEQLDRIERVVSQELAPWRKKSVQERAAAGITNRQYVGMKSLHDEVRDVLNRTLQDHGEIGLQNYERRYAALSQVRDQLQSRINAAELERTSKAMRMARSALQGRAGIASASQAAVADVRMGDILESGFRRLRESGLKAKREVVAARTDLPPTSPPTVSPEGGAGNLPPTTPMQPEGFPAPINKVGPEYAAQQAAQTKLGIRLSKLQPADALNWAGYHGQKTMRVYRGTDVNRSIQAGDFVTTSKESAKKYGSIIVEAEVPSADLKYFSGSVHGDPNITAGPGAQTELIYAPRPRQIRRPGTSR